MFWTEISLGLLGGGGFSREIPNPNLICLNIAGWNLIFYRSRSSKKEMANEKENNELNILVG